MSVQPVALITGASSGIGLETAIALSERGYRLAITGPDVAGLESALKSLPRDTWSIAGDLGDLDFIATLVGKAEEQLGRVDLLVNNAAWRELLTMRQIEAASWERTLRICLTAPAFLARQAAAGMESRGSGVIVNVSSIMANRSSGIATAYIAAKAGLDAVTRDLAVLYGPSGVRVIGIAPGAVDTELSNDYQAEASLAAKQARTFTEDAIPAGRWASAREVAQAIALLSSSELTYLNGTTIPFDGGWSAALYPRSVREQLTGEQRS